MTPRLPRTCHRRGLAAWVLATALAAAPPAWGNTPAGTAIDNTANGAATDSLTGAPFTTTSNTVHALVQPFASVALAPGQGVTAAPATAVLFAHRIRNAGNVALSVQLDATDLAGGAFLLAPFTLTLDEDGDGRVSSGDLPVPNGGAFLLASGDSVTVLVGAIVPAAAPAGGSERFSLVASDPGGPSPGLRALGALASAIDSVTVTGTLAPPALAFYRNLLYLQPTRISALGAPLYVRAVAPQCDSDPAVRDTIRITLASARTGDSDTFAAVETGVHTGIFELERGAPVQPATGVSSASNDGVVQQLRNDRITATLHGCGATTTTAEVFVEPGGMVFDAASGAPVPGVHVQLVDVTGAGNGGNAGGPARVRDWDGVTPASADVVTDANGAYVFPLVDRSVYRLVVVAPAPWHFPSSVPWNQLAGGRTLDVTGSYGGPFAQGPASAPVALDVPLDAILPVALFAEKTASQPTAEPGDALAYQIRVANRSDSLLANVRVHDQLPPGFAYVPHSATLAGAPLADPAGGRGPALDFALGPMAPRSETILQYRVRLGPGTPNGDARNAAVAMSGGATSNTAVAHVLVQGDAFADEAMLTGRVWLAPSGAGGLNPLTGAGGTGIPGVKLFLDDGTYAITDEQGRYSFGGISPRGHALKVDPGTLPAHTRLVATRRRDEGTPGLAFVDLTRGELARVDFMVQGDSLALREAGERRLALAAADERARVLARGTDVLLAPHPSGDPRSLPAERVVMGGEPAIAPPVPDAPAPGAASGPVASVAAATPLDQLVPTLDSDLGFVGFSDLDTVNTNQVTVVVKGRMGTPLTLRVNGQVLSESRVGRRFSAARSGVEAWEYIGVELKAGLNVLEVAPPRSLGRVALRLVAPGPLARLELLGPRRLPADAHSEAALELRLTDAAGVPVGARTLVTLETTLGRVHADDLDPTQPGVQIAVEGGRARVLLLAPGAPGEARVTARVLPLAATATIECLPELRPLFAVGAAEGVLSLQHWHRGHDVQGVPATGFEAPIDQFASMASDGAASAAAHGALYVKGRVRDDMQLTLGYDSDKPADERQFRDQEPDRGYPIVGDASTRGYEAQSTGRLFARLERPDGALLYGDFVTSGPSGGRALGAYGRSLTGVAADWHDERAQLHAFTSRDRSRRQVDELRGQGISGPYQLTRTPIVENSERVELVVRDRNQPALVRTSETKQRFVDYELEPLTGRLLFRSPVPSVDADLDPVSVRVTYEVEDGGAAAWVHGADGHVRVNEKLDVGGAYVDDHDPAGAYQLRSVSAVSHLSAATQLEAEWAGTRHLEGEAGDAERIELRHESGTTQARLYGITTSDGFDNPSAGILSGRREAGGRLSMRLADRTHLAAEALFTGDAQGHERRGGLLVALDRALDDAWRGEIGMRVAGGEEPGLPSEPASAAVRMKLTGQVPAHPEWSGYGEMEQDTREWDRRMMAVGGEYRFHARGRLYARHELSSSLTGAWALTSSQQQLATVVGVDADLARDAHLFSEYRLADALAGPQAQAAVGLRNAWEVADGMRLGTSFERVNPLSGDPSGASTALTGSVDWTDDPQWKGSSRVEVRTSRAEDQFVQSMAAAARLDSAWTTLGRHLLTVTTQNGQGGEAHERLQWAFAYRGVQGWDLLARWELHYDRTAGVETRERRVANVVGFNAAAAPGAGWTPTLAWAGKLTRDETPGLVSAGGGQWLHGRLNRDLTRSWDCGVTASVLTGTRWAQRNVGLGAEVGRQLPNGAWLSLGFNRFGYTDDDLTGEEWTRAGGYLRMRVRFDESLLRRAIGVQP